MSYLVRHEELYEVCRQAIRDGEGTPDAVRRIWRDATAEWAAGREAVQS